MEDQEEPSSVWARQPRLCSIAMPSRSTINQLVDASFQTFANTAPVESEKREAAYHHYRALVDIVSTLRQRVQVKDEIVNKSADDSNQPGGE